LDVIKDETGTVTITRLTSDVDITISQQHQLKTVLIFLTCLSRYPFKCESTYKRLSGMNSGLNHYCGNKTQYNTTYDFILFQSLKKSTEKLKLVLYTTIGD